MNKYSDYEPDFFSSLAFHKAIFSDAIQVSSMT